MPRKQPPAQRHDDAPASNAEPPARTLLLRRALVLALLGSGFALIFLIDRPVVSFDRYRWIGLAAVITLAFIPHVHRPLFRVLERLRNATPSARRRTALVIAVLAAAQILLSAYIQDRDFFPKSHDEHSYVLQMQMLAHGRLWYPPHELAEFFDTFHVFTEPVYASVYFPGTALMYAPGVWLGLPVWFLPLCAAGACIWMVYLVVSELVDGLAGLVAAFALATLNWFRMLALLVMAQVPALLLGLVMFWAWLRWREALAAKREQLDTREPPPAGERHRQRLTSRPSFWMAVIGGCAGWVAITRPVDALAYSIPIGIAILVDLWRHHAAQRSRLSALSRALLVAGATLVLFASPFLALQLIQNKGITGSFTTTPFDLYADRDQPQISYGFHDFDPTLSAVSQVPQKQALYRDFIVRHVKEHRPERLLEEWTGERLQFTIDSSLTARPLLILVPAGLLCLRGRRWALFATLPLFALLYSIYTFYLEHYVVVVAPAVLMLMAMGINALRWAWPRRAAPLTSAAVLGIAFTCTSFQPELHPVMTDESWPSPLLRYLRVKLPQDIPHEAVVMVRWYGSENYHHEPVYNVEAAWPDDNRIIFAHDLGHDLEIGSAAWWTRNRRLFEYYEQHQPDRRFYLLDRGLLAHVSKNPDAPPELTELVFRELGSAREVARKARQAE